MPVTIDFTRKIERVDRKLLVTESSRIYWSKRLLHSGNFLYQFLPNRPSIFLSHSALS